MKLSEFAASLDKMILREEFDLEKQVLKATVSLQLESGNKEIQLHNWEYENTKLQKT